MTLRTLNYGNYGIFLIMGNAGFCPSTVYYTIIAQGLGTRSVYCAIPACSDTYIGPIASGRVATEDTPCRRVLHSMSQHVKL